MSVNAKESAEKKRQGWSANVNKSAEKNNKGWSVNVSEGVKRRKQGENVSVRHRDNESAKLKEFVNLKQKRPA